MTAWRPFVGWLLAVVTFVVAFAFSYGPGALQMSLTASLAASAAAAFTVWLSGVRPVAALAVAVATTLLLPAFDSSFDAMALVIVVVGFQAAMRSDLSAWVLVGSVFVALTVNDIWLRTASDRPFDEPSVLYPMLMTALAVGLGLQSRRVRLQNVELLALRDVDRRRAVSDERRRIARDLHDVAAHHLSALVVRNKLARRLGTTEALDAGAEFSSVTAQDALDAIRQVVHVLGTDESSPLAPQPSLADLDDIVVRMRAAGLEIEGLRDQPASCATVDVTVQVTAVRIVQEALANVLRHRGPGRAWLDVEVHEGSLEVVVEDDGPSVWHASMGDRSWHRPGSHGLVGMHERAEACGGRLAVGPSPRGGWRVCALLPARTA